MGRRFLYLSIYALCISFNLQLSAAGKNEGKGSIVVKEDHCFNCHKELGNLPKDYSDNDIHHYVNISCSSCHGGDPTTDDDAVAMSKAKGFKGVPKKKEIPELCGKCHSDIGIMRVFQPRIATDQVAQYYTSMHGKKLLTGDENVAECSNCHTAHSILPVKDPRSSVYKLNVPNTCNKCHGNLELMRKYNLPVNQLDEFTNSVHGQALLKNKDLGAPACNDCHGNHGAMPPGITSISHVCGICHVSNMEYFNSSPMAKPFQENDFHGCEQCHGYHGVKKPSDNMIGINPESKCVDCHTTGDKGYEVARKIKESLVNLRTKYDLASSKLIEVKQKGMNDIDIGFLLQDAKQDLIQSRTLIHTFDSSKVGSKTKEGIDISNKALMLSQKQIDEYYTRRNGFAAATVAFLLIVVGLYYKIKDKEKKGNK